MKTKIDKAENVGYMDFEGVRILFYRTVEYIFKKLKGNREINQGHVARLKKKIEERRLFSMALVNENMEIIDGQQSSLAALNLGKEIYFAVVPGYTLTECQNYQFNRNWNYDDYEASLIERGYQDYKIYQDFRKYYKLSHTVCQQIIMLRFGDNGGANGVDFREGRLKVNHLERSKQIAGKIAQLFKFSRHAKNHKFLGAFIQIEPDRDFKFKRFLTQFEIHASRYLNGQTKAILDYKVAIQKIYWHGTDHSQRKSFLTEDEQRGVMGL